MSPILSDANIECVNQYIRPYINDEQKFDANILKSYEDTTDPHLYVLPYIGNGKFGIAIDDGSFNIMGKRTLDISIPYYPIVNVDYFGAKSESATVIRFRDGIINKIVCFDYVRKTAQIQQTFYAHRLISSLLVQEIKVKNPSNVPLIIKLKRKGWNGPSEAKSQPMMFHQREQMDYSMIVGQYAVSHSKVGSETIAIAIAAQEIPETIEVNSHSEKTIIVRTFLNHTLPMNEKQIASKIPELKVALREVTKKVIELSSPSLERHHSDTWKHLWNSGFGISHSKAPGALNGDSINATIYYVLSQRRAFPNDNDFLNLSDSKDNKALVLDPDRCYTGHSTLQAPSLWSKMDTLTDVNRITSLWILTLEKQGCDNLINSGAEGTMQSMILSMASLQFTNHHLEFNTHPKELHRNYFIRRVYYGNMTMINITVALGDDNKAQIFVNLDRNVGDKEFYACDGGCLDTPVQLNYIPKEFPVKQTDPLTAILYITANKQHIAELKHTIHVKEVNEAPAHEHQTIVLHQYGHTLGGLPIMFWASIVFLIVIFHLFLGKLIYNEYCGGGATNVQYERHRQGRYAM